MAEFSLTPVDYNPFETRLRRTSGDPAPIQFTEAELAADEIDSRTPESRSALERELARPGLAAIQRAALTEQRERAFGDSAPPAPTPASITLTPVNFNPFTPPKQDPGIWSDIKTTMATGFQGLALDAREIARRVFGERVVAAVDAVDEWMHGKPSEPLIKEKIQKLQEQLSPKMAAALQKEWWNDETNTLGEAWSDPRSYLGNFMQSLPGTVATMGPSLAIARGVFTAQIARGVAEKTAAANAATAATIAGGLTEGLQQAGQTGREVRDQILGMDESQFADSDALKILREQGMPFDEARAQLADDASGKAMIIAGVATGIFGGQGDRLLAKAFTKGLTGNLAARMAQGAAAEGLVEEFPQSYLSRVGANIGLQEAQPGIPTTSGALSEGLGGAVVGGLMGGGVAALSRRAETATQPTPVVAPPAPTGTSAPSVTPILTAPDVDSAIEATAAVALGPLSEPLIPQAIPEGSTVAEGFADILPPPEATTGPGTQEAALADMAQDADAARAAVLKERQLDTLQAIGQEPTAMELAMGQAQERKAADIVQAQEREARDAEIAARLQETARQEALRPQPTDLPALTKLARREALNEQESTALVDKGLARRLDDGAVRMNEQGYRAYSRLRRAQSMSDGELDLAGRLTRSPERKAEIEAEQARRVPNSGTTQPNLGMNVGDAAQVPTPTPGAQPPSATQSGGAQAAPAPVTLTPVPPGRNIVRGQFRGEFMGADGQYIGSLHQVAKDEWRVLQVDNGRVLAESRPLRKDEIERAGGYAVSASQSVRQFSLASPAQPAATPLPAAKAAPSQEGAEAAGAAVIPPISDVSVPQGQTKVGGIIPSISDKKSELPQKIGGRPVANIKTADLKQFATKGGPRIRPIAQAELDRREEEVRQDKIARELEKSRSAPSKQLFSMIVKFGGINKAEALDITGDKGVRGLGPYARLFRERKRVGSQIVEGRGLDELAVHLVESGWLPQETLDEGDGGVQTVRDMIRDAIDGTLQPFSQRDVEKRAEAELEARGLTQEQEAEAQALSAQAGNAPDAWATMSTEEQDSELDEIFGADTREKAQPQGQEARAPTDPGAVEQAGEEGQVDGPTEQEAAARTDADDTEAAAPASGTQETPAQEEPPLLALTGETEEEIRAREAREKEAAESGRDVADRERDSFSLTSPTATPEPSRTAQTDMLAPSPEYAIALEKSRAATAEFQKVQTAYRKREISDDDFLAAKARYEQASAEFDAAYAKEQNRKPEPNPLTAAAEALRDAAQKLAEAARPAQSAPAERPAAEITDFGEKIGGARKDVWQAFKDRMRDAKDVDVLTQPLSKSWPEPDYQALLNAGADPWAVAFMHAARDEVPPKPRREWKAQRWAELVTMLRDVTMGLAEGTISTDRAKTLLAEKAKQTRGMSDIEGRIDLYELVGHEKSLAGIRVSSGQYSLYEGKEYNPPKVIWTVEKKAKATAFSNWPSMLATGDTKAEAMQNFKEKYDSLLNEKVSKEVSFDIFSKVGENGYHVGKKIGRHPLLLAGPFKTVMEARAYKREHQEELVAKLEKAKEIPNERRDTNEPRVGEDMRGGQNVTPQMFSDTFGFRGVEFGNWVEQERRQQDLNEAFDALMDMAAILNIPPRAISLNGELGLAFGARGTGGLRAAKAHYEPGSVVINLTKREGAGSIGHEWWHALDNYFSRVGGEKEGFVTGAGTRDLAKMMRAEMAEAFGGVKRAIRETAMRARSSKLDAKRSKDYWTTGHEMSARAYESYLISKLQDQNASNDYLANIVDEATWKAAESMGFELDDSYPYPTAGEIPKIRAAFDHFFTTVQTRETDRGVAMFSRSRFPGAAVSMRDAQAVVAEIRRALPGAPPIHVHEKVSQAPKELLRVIKSRNAEGDIEAAFHEGEVHVFPQNIRDIARLRFVVSKHELRHYGMRALLGPEMDSTMLAIYDGNESIRREADSTYATGRSKSISEAVEEALADTTVEDMEKLKGFDRLIAAIRRALRVLAVKARARGYKELADLIEPKAWTDNDIVALVARSEAMSLNQDAPFRAGGTALSETDRPDQTQTPEFRRFMEGSRVTKTGEPWAKPGDELVVYHGTGGSFYTFNTVEGAFFSSSHKVAAGYAKDRAGWRIVHAKSGLPVEGTGGAFQTKDEAKQFLDAEVGVPARVEKGTPTTHSVYLSITNPLEVDAKGAVFNNIEFEGSKIETSDLLITAARRGHDGLIVRNVRDNGGGDLRIRSDIYAVRDPEQIKSAIGNVGSFDPKNPDIRFSLAGWIDQQPEETQEALRKAGVWHVPPTLKARVSTWSADWQKRLKQGVVDQFDPIKELDYHAYMLARMTRGADNALDGLLNYGTVFMDKDGAIDVNFEKGGFLGIMSKLKGEHDRFLAWVIGNRAERLLAEGREHNFTPQDIQRLKALSQGQMKDGTPRPQEYARVRAELDRYNKAVLDIAEKAGLIDGAGRAAWEKDFYVPFYRLMEGEDGKQKGPIPGKGLVNQYAFKVLKGGEQALGDPMENILKNWAHLLDASLKNQAARESLLAAGRIGAVVEGPEATVRQMAKAAGLKDAVVSFTDQGEQRWFMVEDPFLLDAIKGIGFTGFQGTGMKVMQKFKKWLTMGVTVSPTFRIRNVIRDSLQMIGANPASYNVLDNVLTGWKATKDDTPEYASILAGGGVMRFGTILDGDRAEHVKRLIELGVDDKTILTTPERVRDALTQAWDWWQGVGDRAENVNRAALYKKLRREGKTHLEASFAARDTMDFSMQGTWAAIRFLSQTVPFFNARLQGLYKLGRGAAEDPRRFGIVVGAATIASLALLLAYGDDDDWKKREDWDRETFWWFRVGDKAFRIPKPFEIGAIATIAERAAEAMMTDELTGKQFAKRLFSIVSQQLSMNPVPQMAMPLIELYANRDSFTDRPIEGIGVERLSKSMRIGPNTSATAQLLGKNGLISPLQIDHLVNGYFGWLGSHIVSTADLALRPAMGLPGKPAWRVDDVLVVGDFVKDLPAYQSKYVTRMYDQMKEVQQSMADLRELQKAGSIEEARDFLQDNKDKLKLYRLYTNAEQQMQKVNRQIKMVQARAGDADEKRERLDALYDVRNRIARITEERARAAAP